MDHNLTRRTRRRAAVAVAAGAAALLALTACAPPSAGQNPSDPGTDDSVFTVGVIASTTGFVAAIGADMNNGWDLFWEQQGTRAGAYEVRTIVEDDASDSTTALTKARRLVEEEHVDIVVGPVLANNSLAVADYLAQEGVANLSQTAADDLTQRRANDTLLRTGSLAASQMTFPGGQYAYDEGYRTAATICVDYAFGWESCGGFASAFLDAGGSISKQLWYPGDATDLSSYVSQLSALDVDVIFAGTAGGTDSSNFVRSAKDFGLLGSVPIINNCCTTDQFILQDVGDMALGLTSVSMFAEGSDDPTIAAFVSAYEDKYGSLPSSYALGMYATAQLVAAALENATEKPTGSAFITAAKQADVSDWVWGDASFDEQGNMVGPVYVRTVEERGDGTLWNAPIKTYDAVSQFWKYDPSAYLANPPFSQEFTSQR